MHEWIARYSSLRIFDAPFAVHSSLSFSFLVKVAPSLSGKYQKMSICVFASFSH